MISEPCDCEIGYIICCAPDQCATTITLTTNETTTEISRSTDYWWWSRVMGYTTSTTAQDACEMIYGTCDCESGRIMCCIDECSRITSTAPPKTLSFSMFMIAIKNELN